MKGLRVAVYVQNHGVVIIVALDMLNDMSFSLFVFSPIVYILFLLDTYRITLSLCS
jgi:hypothetical protein